MTDEEYRNKYPIGTTIRWIPNRCNMTKSAIKDIGKIGKIVGYTKQSHPLIFLPESEHFSSNSTQAIPISWWAIWKDVEILSQKGKQLMFAFMEK